jgi:dUTP pyrophosphatase
MTLRIMFVDEAAQKGDVAAQELLMPKRGTAEAAGLDLVAANDTPIGLAPGTHQMIPTGIAMALPKGFEGQVRPRSGLAAKHGITVLNSPGTIDSDYRGEVRVILINLGQKVFEVTRGMRIAQLIISRVELMAVETKIDLEETDRGAGGFGSTGIQNRL